MRLREAGEVRRENNQLTTVFNNPAKLVTGFASHPQFVVMLIKQGDDTLEFASGIADMNTAANFSSTPKRFTDLAGEERVRN